MEQWIAQPTAKDIEILKRLPPEQRGELSRAWKPIIDEAKAKGMDVSPSLAKALVGTAKVGTISGATTETKKRLTPKELLDEAQRNLQSQFQQQGLAPQ